MKNSTTLSALLLSAGLLASCGGGEATDSGSGTAAADEAAVPAHFWSDTPLAGAKNVKEIRDGDVMPTDVVVRGTLQDFGELATFKLVEDSLDDCTELADDCECPTPWDYCCEDIDALTKYTINVELMDEGDMPGSWTLKGYKGLDHLSEVVVSGKLTVDEAGNMRIAAEKIAMQ